MRQTFSDKYQDLFSVRGGRAGKKNKAIASRNGKYHHKTKHSDKRRETRLSDNLPKEMTKAYFRLTQELDQFKREKDEKERIRFYEEWDMLAKEIEEDMERQLREEKDYWVYDEELYNWSPRKTEEDKDEDQYAKWILQEELSRKCEQYDMDLER